MSSAQYGSHPPIFQYCVNQHQHRPKCSLGSLVDRGANEGILGSDAGVIFTHLRTVNVTGIDNHQLDELKIVDGSTTATTQYGDVIIILRQYALFGRDRTIHSCAQLEYFKNTVNDKSMQVGGFQHISTQDGYLFPLDIVNGRFTSA